MDFTIEIQNSSLQKIFVRLLINKRKNQKTDIKANMFNFNELPNFKLE